VALPQTPARKKADGWRPCLEITNKQVMQAITRAVVEAWEAGG
jgi:hypothetical protein